MNINKPSNHTYSEAVINALVGLTQLMHNIPGIDTRQKVRPSVELILKALGARSSEAAWLCGRLLRNSAPPEILTRARELGIIKPQKKLGAPPRFIELEWLSSGDTVLTFYPLAAQELGISEESLRARMKFGKGIVGIQRPNPDTGNDDSVTVRRLAEQPHESERAALTRLAEEHLAEVLAKREAWANRFKPKGPPRAPVKRRSSERPLGPHQGRRY